MRYLASLGLIGLLGCNQKVEAPSIYSPNRQMNFDACRNASVDLRNLTATSLKGLITCLNGTDGQLQAYKDFVDSISNEDLESMIKVFDRHITRSGNRLDLMLDLSSRARDKGFLKQLYAGINTVTQAQSLQETVELLGKVYARYQKSSDYAKHVAQLRSISRDLILQKTTDQVIQGGARGFNGGKGQALAYFLSRTSSRFPMASDEIVDDAARVGKSLIQTRALKTLQILAGDPAVYQAFGSLTNAELQEIEKLFVQISRGASRGDVGILTGLQKLTLKTDRPMRCFDNGTDVRNFQNLFDVAADEQSRRRKDYDRINRFWLVELPIMISASLSKCDLDRSVTTELEITSDLAKRGLATGLAMSLLGFYDKGRGEYIKDVLKSQHSIEAGGLIENLAIRQGTTFLIELLTKSFKPADFQALGQIMTGAVAQNFKGPELDAWLVTHFREPLLSEIRSHLATLPADRKDLLGLLARLEQNGPSDLSRSVRVALANDVNIPLVERATFEFIGNALSDDVRPNLKKAAAALVRSWESSGTGWGGVIEFAAQTLSLSEERPFQDAIASLLAHETDYETLINFMVRYSQDARFHEALRFTGEIAGDGNLDRLVSFLLDFFKATGAPGLNPAPNTPGYTPANDKLNLADLENRKLPEPSPAPGDYTYCQKVTGDLFEPTGETLFSAMKCFDFNKGGSGFSKLADLLKNGGLLRDVTRLVSERFFDPNYVHVVLDDMRAMYDSGHFSKLFQLLQMAVEDPYHMHELIDPALSGLLASPRTDFALQGLGQLLSSPSFATGASAGVGALGGDLKPSVITSKNDYVMPLNDEAALRAQAFSKVPGLTENAWQRAKAEFTTRSRDYLYRQGVYRPYTDDQLRNEIVDWFRKLVVENPETGYGDAEALVDTINDLAVMEANKQINMAEFFRWGSTNQKAVPYWVGESDNPEVRLVTPFDQLDILVSNSNMPVKVLFIGPDHLGTFFQIEIAKSTNFIETLDHLKTELEKGLNVCGGIIPLLPKKTCNHLRNNYANFDALYDMARKGHMPIQQRLYQAFRASTPARYYDKQDPVNNHIAMTHKHVDWAMFARQSAALHNVESQGLLNQFGAAVARAGPLFNRQDVPKLRAAFKKLLANRPNRTSDFGYLIDGLFNLMNNDPAGFLTFKDMMFHFVLNWPNLTDRTTGVVEVFDLLANDEAIVRQSIDWIFRDLKKPRPDGALYKSMVNLRYVEPGPMAAIRNLGSLMLRPNRPSDESYALSFADMMVTLFKRDEVTYDELFTRLKEFSNDAKVKQLGPVALLQEMIPRYTGMRKIIAAILNDPTDRRTIETLLKDMSREKVGGELLKTLVGIYQSGDLENLIYFLNKHAVKVGSTP